MSDGPKDNPAVDRMTDGGIVTAGDDVIWDGEAEKYGFKSKVGQKRKAETADDGWGSDEEDTGSKA